MGAAGVQVVQEDVGRDRRRFSQGAWAWAEFPVFGADLLFRRIGHGRFEDANVAVFEAELRGCFVRDTATLRFWGEIVPGQNVLWLA